MSAPRNEPMNLSIQKSQTTQHWAVVGGGILGMTLALRLSQQGHRVTLLESLRERQGSPQTPGGSAMRHGTDTITSP